MISPVSKNPLVQKIATGEVGGDLLQFLLDRQLPLTDEEYLEAWSLVRNHPLASGKAEERLRSLPESVRANYVARKEAHPAVVEWIVAEALANGQIEILLGAWNNPGLDITCYVIIAEWGPVPLLEVLIENQIRLIGYPEILEALERNPACSPFLRGKIDEIRRFYLTAAVAEPIPADRIADVEDVLLLTSPEETNGSVPSEEIHQRAVTTLERINAMSVSERIKLALSGTKTERMILLRDANRMVAMAVLESPKMSDDDVLLIARDKSMPGELVAKVAANRYWTRNYNVVLELLQNPKTPTNRAMAFVKQLHMRDLRQIMIDKNTPPVIRTVATNLYREKNKVGK